MEVLEGLGEETMQAILWQMGDKGISFAPETFDIKPFSLQLKDLFGDGANSLLEEIYLNFECRLELIATMSNSREGLTPLQKIQNILDGRDDRDL
jgi:hypothetical protein